MEISQEYLDNAVATTHGMLNARAAGVALLNNGALTIRSFRGSAPRDLCEAFCRRIADCRSVLTEEVAREWNMPCVIQGSYIHRQMFEGAVFIVLEHGQRFADDMLALLGRRFEFLIEVGMRADQYETVKKLVPELAEKLQRVLNTVRIGIWEWDVSTNEVEWDESMYRLYKRDPADATDQYVRWEQALYPEDRERINRLTADALADPHKDFLNMHFRVYDDHGHVIHLVSKAKIFRDADGRAVHMSGVNLDVTDEEATSEKLRRVLHVVKVGIWEWDIPKNVVTWDESMYRLYGRKPRLSANAYEDWLSSLHPDDLAVMNERNQMLIEDTAASDLELRFRVVHQDGSVHYILAKAEIRRDPYGNALRMLGINIDITREEILLEEIAHHRDDLKQLFDNMHEGVVINDGEGMIVQCNPAALRILKCREADLVGRSTADIGRRAIDENWKPTPVRKLSIYQAIETGKPVIGRISGMYLPNGELIWIRINVVPLMRAGDVRPHRLLVTFEDITEMRKYMQRLSDEKARYEHLVYGLNEAACVSMTDLQGQITMMNDKFVNLIGYRRSDILGHTHRIMKSGVHDASFHSAVWRTISGGSVWHGEYCNRSKTGKLIWLDTTIIPMLNADGSIESYMSVRFDITAKREFEQQLYESREAEIRANSAKSEFLARMSHEIRTPMNGIIGMAQLLMDTNLDAEQRDCSQTIVNSGDLLLTIINDILDLSKIESGRVELDTHDFDLAAYIRDIMKTFVPVVRQKSISLNVDTFTDNCFVRGDRERIGQIIMNLVGNAVKFTERGGVTVTLARITDDIYTICIKDTGIGISDDAKSRLFTAFSQANKDVGKKYGGTGLGLVIAKKLTELMGGSINFFSTVGKGSTFITTLHLLPGTPPKSSAPPAETAEVDPDARVLVAEDNLVNQKIVMKMLQRIGCKARVVENGADAVAVANDADVILMDCQMPVMDGYEATQALRCAGYTKPIVALTANALSGDADKCIEAGMDDYLSKPINLRTLTQMLAKYVPKNKKR